MSRGGTILVSRTLYQLGVLTLIASIMWVGVGIYSATTAKQKVSVNPEILSPISPTLNLEVVEALNKRVKVVRVEPVAVQEITVEESEVVEVDSIVEEEEEIR